MTGTARQSARPATAQVSIRLHLACGRTPDPGFVGIDDAAVFPWPLDTSSVGEAVCVDYVHRTTPVGGQRDGLVTFMNELHRVLVPAGTARIVHPHARSDRALRDPTAARLISDQTWWFFDRGWREREGCDRPEITADFDIVTMDAPLALDWDQRADRAQAFALEHYWNVVGDLQVVVRARKAEPRGCA